MKRFILMIVTLSLCVGAWAIPARRGGIVLTDANGNEKTVFLHGNEHFHYMTDEQGRWLDEKTLVPMSEAEKERLQQAGETRQRQVRRAMQQKTGIGDKPNPAPRGLVILVDFQDKAFVTPKDTLDSLHNGAHFTRSYSYKYTYKGKTYEIPVTSEGSVRKYFQDQSYGQYNPVFDLIGPLQLSLEISYYGSNNDANAPKMIKEACELADQAGADFSQYDNDNDGVVDFVYVVYAGYGEADGGGEATVWPHQWNLIDAGISLRIDGKKVNRYACGNEINKGSNVYNGIGTFCHEFGHVLGLPDFYETNNPQTGLHTLCDWDIMDYGPYNNDGNTPPSYSAYERFYMGWLTPRMLSKPEDVTLYPINEDSGSSLLISTANTHNMSGWNPNPTKYYLLEVRTQEGWDIALPGPGMLITKVDFVYNNWIYNKVNNNGRAFGMDILEADENVSRYGLPTDAYPAGATEWTAYEDHEITDITLNETTGAVSFKYRGGKQTPVENVSVGDGTPAKILRNGQVVIVREGKIYSITGAQLR